MTFLRHVFAALGYCDHPAMRRERDDLGRALFVCDVCHFRTPQITRTDDEQQRVKAEGAVQPYRSRRVPTDHSERFRRAQ